MGMNVMPGCNTPVMLADKPFRCPGHVSTGAATYAFIQARGRPGVLPFPVINVLLVNGGFDLMLLFPLC